MHENTEQEQEQEQEQIQDDGLYYPPGYQRNAEPKQRKAEGEDPIVVLKKGWEEDRLRLDKLEEENKELKLRISSRDGEEEDLSGLTEDERVEKLLAKRELEKKQEQERREAKEQSELKYLRITDKFFAENEKDILKLKNDEGLTLAQSVKIFRKQQELISKLKPETKTVFVEKKPAKTNKAISIGDMYREGI